MSPTSLPRSGEGFLVLPRRWSIAALVGLLTWAGGMLWQGSAAYGRLGTLETTVAKNEARIEEGQRDRERLARLEAQGALTLEALRRIDAKLDRVR